MRPALLIGIAAFSVAFGVAAWTLVSIPAPRFSIAVAPESARAPEGRAEWRVMVTPASDRDRLVARLDRRVDLDLQPVGDDAAVASLAGLAPGYHFVEASVYRRGGRTDAVVDVIAAGPFQGDRDRGCDAAFAMSPETVRLLLLPAVERKVLAGAAAQEDMFGPTTYVVQSRLEVVDGGVAFAVELDTTAEGKGDLAIEGVVDVSSASDAGLALSLRTLDRATPGPKLEEIAESEGGRKGTAAGIGGGATIGGVVGGPVGAVIGGAIGGLAGRAVGKKLGQREAGRRTRAEVEQAIVAGLALATEELRLPSDFALLPTAPVLRADARWCSPLTLRASEGIRASVRIGLHEDDVTAQAAAAAVYRGQEAVPIETLGDASVAVDVSQDLLNRVLAEWTLRGGLTTALADAGLRDALQAELTERTRWEVQSVEATAAPAVQLERDAIGVSFGDIGLRMFDPGRDVTRDVTVGGVGDLTLRIVDGTRMRLGGKLEEGYFGCRGPDAEARILPACFVGAVDPTQIRSRINLAIVLHTATLPTIDLTALTELHPPGSPPPDLALTGATLTSHPAHLTLTATLSHPRTP